MIHDSAILEGDIDLAEDVIIGPNCVLRGPVTLGAGTELVGNVYLHGPLTMGRGNVVYPFVCLGFAPQHTKFDPSTPGPGLVIGDSNTFREGAIIHRAFSDDAPTRIGSNNYFMTNTHAGHDCQVGDFCTFVTAVAVGGHCKIADRVTIGGHTVVHQFCRIGRGAMLSGAMGLSADLPPWFMLTGINIAGAVNLVGLRRNGFTGEQIDTVKWVYRTLYNEGRSLRSAIEALRARASDPLVAEYVQFIEEADRPIVLSRPAAARGA